MTREKIKQERWKVKIENNKENGDHLPLGRKRPENQRTVVEDVHVWGVRGQGVPLPRGPRDGGGW